MLSFKPAFLLSSHFHQEALQFLFILCHKGGVICILRRDLWASQVMLALKNPPASAGDTRDTSSIPELGRFPGRGHGNPFQYSYLENPMDRGAWWATGCKELDTTERLSAHTHRRPARASERILDCKPLSLHCSGLCNQI